MESAGTPELWAMLNLTSGLHFSCFFFVVGGIFKDTKVVLEQLAASCDLVRHGGSRMVRTKL